MTAAAKRGALLAEHLRGAWRTSPPPVDRSSAAWEVIAPLLLAAGTGGLGWWRIRHSAASASPAGRALRDAYRMQALQSALQEGNIVRAVTHLRKAGVEPLLAKGWAVARHYAAPGLRPCGDIDLCVPLPQVAAAKRALAELSALTAAVDLHGGLEHTGFALLDDRPLEELYARSQLVPLGPIAVRVPGAEDHLRLLCLHMLGHGARRPLWLCDVAAALELRPPDFDWDWCLGGDQRRAEWVTGALLLAQRLLGAAIEDTPLTESCVRLPRWLIPTVLRGWGRPFHYPVPMATFWRHPTVALAEFRHRWPNAIEGTLAVRGPFDEWPRLPLQLSAFARRSALFLRHLRDSGSS